MYMRCASLIATPHTPLSLSRKMIPFFSNMSMKPLKVPKSHAPIVILWFLPRFATSRKSIYPSLSSPSLTKWS